MAESENGRAINEAAVEMLEALNARAYRHLRDREDAHDVV
jgi:hypothetical protein